MELIKSIEEGYKKAEIPEFNIGDTIKLYIRVFEGDKERLQPFEGVVIARKGGSIKETVMVRKISFGGIGVERIFPLHSPSIDRIEVTRKGDVRRAKLYYLRDKKGKAAKVKEKSRATAGK